MTTPCPEPARMWMRLSEHWQDIAAVAAVWTVVSALLSLTFRPLFDRQWLSRFARNKDSVRAMLNGWYDVTPQRASFQKLQSDHAELYKRLGELVSQAEDNYDQLGSRIEKAMEKQGTAMEAIAKEAQETALTLSHLRGVIESRPWDGKERRENERRRQP